MLAQKLVKSTRDNMFRLISRAYSTISVSQAAQLFGLPENEVIQNCIEKGWTLEGNYLLPRRAEEETHFNHANLGLEELQTLTEQLVRLQAT